MSDVNDTTPLKRCAKCKREFPATAYYFHRYRKSDDGLCYRCKKCNGGKNFELQPTTQAGCKRCTKCGEEKPATSEYFQRHSHKKDGLYSWCKTCRHSCRNNPESTRKWRLKHPDYHRQWRESNPEYQRQYFQKNREAIHKRSRNRIQLWRRNNRERIREYTRDYCKKNSLLIRVNEQRRRALERSLPSTFTTEQWQICLEYFHHTCAYCGAQQSFWHVLEQEHVIPVSAGGGYTADNIVPACGHCNASKNNRQVTGWLESKFGKRKASQIIERVEVYFRSLKQH